MKNGSCYAFNSIPVLHVKKLENSALSTDVSMS